MATGVAHTIRFLIVMKLLVVSPATVFLYGSSKNISDHSNSKVQTIHWKSDCDFIYTAPTFTFKLLKGITIGDCGNFCLNSSFVCSFVYFFDSYCHLILTTAMMLPSDGDVEPAAVDLLNLKEPNCGYVVPARTWLQSLEDERIWLHSNCTFNPLFSHQHLVMEDTSFSSCKSTCLNDNRCTAFTYNKSNRKCTLPFNQEHLLDDIKVDQLLFYQHHNLSSAIFSSECAIINRQLNTIVRPRRDIADLYEVHNAEGWNSRSISNDSYKQILWRNDCYFSSNGDSNSVSELEGNITAEECGNECLNHPMCNHFIYHQDQDKPHPNSCKLKNWIGNLMKELTTLDIEGPKCGFVPMRTWQKSIDDDRILVRYNCSFPSSTTGRDVIRHEKSFTSCRNACLDDHRCNAFSYDKEDNKCVMPHQRSEYESHVSSLEIIDLFRLHPPYSAGSGDCAVVSTRINSRRRGEMVITKNDCDYALPFETKLNATVDACESQCFTASTCIYFSHDGTDCYLMFELELVQPTFNGKKGWTCGYIPNKIWDKSSDDKRILVKTNCSFPTPSAVFGKRNELSFSSCQNACLEDHRCNAFSYSRDDKNCVMPHTALDFETSWTHLSLSELLRLRSPLESLTLNSQCAVVSSRNWKFDVHQTDSSNSSIVLYQDDCDFNMAFNIEEPHKQKNLNDCITYCLNVTRCTHFSYNSTNNICRVKKAPALTDRLATAGSDKTCGYIPDRIQQSEEEDLTDNLLVYIAVLIVSLLLAITVFALKKYIKNQRAYAHLRPLLKGSQDEIDHNRPLDEQAQDLIYDKRWEFPVNRLRFESEVGSGAFGRVVKADAIGLKKEEEQQVMKVAVKMIHSHVNSTNGAIESLIGELKILIHVGVHVNVVNLLGACTKRISRGELLVIVEYCRFGNLCTFLRQKRMNFVNTCGLNENPTEIITVSPDLEENLQQLPEIPEWGMDYRSDSADGNQSNNYPISTRDLISWSFQIARGMDFLVSKQVLHGDLAARNVLLADDGVVKVADFGLARQFYVDYDYIKQQQGLLPVKWMAIESLRDWIFSSQSDVWSFGVALWEIFSLAKVPYAGLAVDDEFILRLENGYRMEKPELMPENISRLMTDCWKTEPHQRPTFSQLTESLGEFTEAAGGGSRHLQIGNSNSQNSIKSFDGDVSPATHVTTRDAVAATAATNETAF